MNEGIFTVGSLFTGIGGMDLGLERAGMRIEWMVEIDPFCQKVLAKHWPDVARYGDIRDFSAWVVDENEGLCYNKICEPNGGERQVYETLNEQSKLKRIGELLVSARIAGNKCPFLQALLIGVGDSAPHLVSMNTCGVSMEQMQMAELGCAEQETLTGRVAPGMNVSDNTVEQKLRDGEGEYSPVIDMYAKDAGELLGAQINYEHTTLSTGQLRQTRDLNSLMESLYAKDATWKCTRRKATIDLICGGVPCQPASVAGKRRGTADDRWLWPEVIRVVREFRPTWCLFENVPGLLSLERGTAFDQVLSDLEGQGYTCWTFNIPACAFDAPHRRERIFIVAHSQCDEHYKPKPRGIRTKARISQEHRTQDDTAGWSGRASGIQSSSTRYMAYTDGKQAVGTAIARQERNTRPTQPNLGMLAHGLSPGLAGRWLPEPPVGRVATGIPDWDAKLRALGNAVVPAVAQWIGERIMEVEEVRE